MWRETAGSLSRFCRPVTVDLRGHGESDWSPDGLYSEALHFADLRHLIRSRAFGRMVLVGHSLGASLCLDLTLAFPEAVMGLVLIDYSPDWQPAVAEQVRSGLADMNRPFRSLEAFQIELMKTRPLLEAAQASAVASGSLRLTADGCYAPKADPALAAVLPDPDVAENWAKLGRVACRTLIVRGAMSAVLSAATARRMVDQLQWGRLETVPLAGHSVVSERPREVSAIITEFMRSTLPAAPLRV